MMKKLHFYFLLLLIFMLPTGQSFANSFSSSQLICAADVFDVQDDSKQKHHQSQKTKSLKKRKKSKFKNWWQRHKKKVSLTFLGASMLGLFFRKKRRRRRRRRTDRSTLWYILFMCALGLAGCGGLAVLFGFSFWTGVWWGVIAFAFLALIIGIFALAW